MTTIDIRAETAELKTLRDFLRYAVSQYNRAGLFFGQGSSTALDEAVFLILDSLDLPIDDFNAFAEARLATREKAMLGERIARRVEERVPAAYLTGRSYLHGFRFRADPRALVPRSFIADLLHSPLFDGTGDALELISDPGAVTSVLDLCTGGGSLAIIAAHVFPEATLDAVDLSGDALALAAENVADYGLDGRIALLEGDLFAPVAGRKYDLILTNPPYVDATTMAMLPDEYRAEPDMALAAGEDGFDIVRRILAKAKSHLNDEGGLLCEIGLDREILESEYPDTPFLWLDTEQSDGEVFWLARDHLPG